MQIQISGLMPGDVLIIKYNDTYWHTMLVVNNNRIAHAPSPGEPCVMEALASFASETKAEHTWNDSQLLERLYAASSHANVTRPNLSSGIRRTKVEGAPALVIVKNQLSHK
jgi:hypothetical protein